MTGCIGKEKIDAFRKLLGNARKVALAAHVHPDGDALGCVTALALYLKRELGKEVVCLFPDSLPESLEFAKNPSLRYLTGTTEDDADLIILMDCNSFSRTDVLGDSLAASRAPKVLIDHHLNPAQDSFSLVFSTPDISSASELTFWILKALGWDLKDRETGEAILTGMTTDTNNFANSVFPSTFTMASELIAAGVDRDALLQKIYFSYRENRVRLMGYMQNEALKILPEGAAYMILTKEIQQRFDLKEGESEGLVNVPLSIKEVRLSLLLKEYEDHFRVSLRSKKGTSAQQCALKYFNGGGHENAAGGRLYPATDLGGKSLEEYVKHALLESL